MNLPKARTSDIIEQAAGSELMIYDLRNDKAYTLNETSKIIYRACGVETVEEIKRRHKFTDDLIYFALDELAANNLIENYQNAHFGGISRREIIKRVGLATLVALPVIASIAAPAAANAASLTTCQRLSCADARVGPNGGCNPPAGCAALGYVCCAVAQFGSCTCATVASCSSNNGEICPGIV